MDYSLITQNLQLIINSIEEKRKSKVVTLIISDGMPLSQDMTSVIVEQLEYIQNHFDGSTFSKIDLLLYSRGGDSDAPWSIVRKIREYFPDKEFGVLIPHRAHSAATVISIGADEIIMGPNSELGPIDATVNNGPYNPIHEINKTPLPLESESLTGYFSFINDKLQSDVPELKSKALDNLKDKVHPLAIGGVYRILQQTKYVAQKMLEYRREKLDPVIINKITKTLSSEIYSHRHPISRQEAISIGITFVKYAEEYDIQNEFSQLLKLISSNLKFDNLNNNQYTDEEWKLNNDKIVNNIILAIVQSDGLSKLRLGEKIEQKQYTPFTNINISSPINIQLQLSNDLFQGIAPDQQQLIGHNIQEALSSRLNTNTQSIINTAAQKMLEELKNSQPFQILLQINAKEWQTLTLEKTEDLVPPKALKHGKKTQ